MSFFSPQNPGIGLTQFTIEEELFLVELASLGDPGADRIFFWDDSAGGPRYLEIGSGLSITGTTLTATGGGGGHTIQDNGTPLTQRTNLNFVGATVTDDAGNDATVITITGGSGTPGFKDQTPQLDSTYGLLAGTVNGTNTTFTVSDGAYTSGDLTVYLNGQKMQQGSTADWVETTPASGTFDFIVAPLTGDVISVEYGGGGTLYTDLTEFVDQTAWRLFYSNGSGDVTELALGSSGTYLKSNGATSAPTFDTPGGSGDVTAASAFSNDNRLIRSDGTGKAVQASGITLDDTDNLSGVGTLNTHTIPGGTGTIALTSDIDVDGSGTTNQFTYWSDSNTIAGSSELVRDGTNIIVQTTPFQVKNTSTVVHNLTHNNVNYLSNGSGGQLRMGFGGVTSPTAKIHVGAGTTAASTAPLKFTAGTNMTTPEAGAIEFDGTDLFYTDSGATRRTVANTGDLHSAVTVTDSSEIDFTLTGQDITASLIAGSIDETKLDASVNASLDLADSASQPGHTHTLANITDITASAAELNVLDGITSTTAELNILDGVTATASELNTLDGITATVTELNYTDGVTSAIQTQLNAKLDSSAYDDATAGETNTGTSTAKYVSPDGLAGSNIGIRYISFSLNGTTALTTSDKAYQRIPAGLTGMNLISVTATVGTGAAGSSSSGTPTFTVTNVTDAASMLSTNLTVDASEYTSATATTAAVINTSTDDVVTDDLIEVACTTAGTGVTYAVITLGFQLP